MKVLDFGVARGLDPARRRAFRCHSKLSTTPGMAVGTIGYMSPEQVLGHPADQRSDLFSLGVGFYEMGDGSDAVPGRFDGRRLRRHPDADAPGADGSVDPD